MRFTVFILISLVIVQISKSQELKNFDAININIKFKLELIKIDSFEFTYKIVSKEPFNKKLNLNSTHLLLEDSSGINQIQGIFTMEKFGNSESAVLIIKSGYDSPLKYNLFIDSKGRGNFKNTSTVSLYSGIPSLEMWPNYIYSIKILGFSKVNIEPSKHEAELDTTCISELDIDKGNILINEQLSLISEIISHQEKLEIEKLKDYEESIKSISVSSWGWGDELNILDSRGRLIGTYINRKKISQPLVFKITECPYLEREVAYFFSKKRKDVKFVVFKWSQRWVDGWQSRAYNIIESDFRLKYEFIRNSLNKILGSPSDCLIEGNRRFQTEWKSNEGVIAKTYLYIDQYSRSLKLYIYKKDE